MSGGFKRSGLFGIVGVFVVAAIVIVIAITGQDGANPKLTLGLIFGVIAIFCLILFALQRSDLERAAGAHGRDSERAATEGGRQVDNPTTLSEPELWAALAVKPIDAEAVRARSRMWGSGRRSLRLAMVVTLLIFLTVPAIYLLESFIPLLIGGPLIAIAALYGSFRALAPGGELDQGYDDASLALRPLGLKVTERPKVEIEMRDPVQPRLGPRIHGAVVMKGRRYGNQVAVRLDSGEVKRTSEVTVAAPGNAYEVKSKRVEIRSGPEGIVVARKGGEPADWLCDLWLAERLAAAA